MSDWLGIIIVLDDQTIQDQTGEILKCDDHPETPMLFEGWGEEGEGEIYCPECIAHPDPARERRRMLEGLRAGRGKRLSVNV